MSGARFDSLDDFIARTGVRREELPTLAEVGALNAFGYDRRAALWQIEKAVRKEGALFKESGEKPDASPLPTMTPVERGVVDYERTGLTIGPHPMSFRRRELGMRGCAACRRFATRSTWTSCTRRRCRDYPTTSWYRERVRLSDTRRRDRRFVYYRSPATLCRAKDDHSRAVVSPDRRTLTDPGWCDFS